MQSNRMYSYDVVRVVAMMFVVAVHSLRVVSGEDFFSSAYELGGDVLFISANALFFMLSGKLNLRVRDGKEGLARYYRKRVRGFLLPILILFLIRTGYDMYPDWGSVFHFFKAYIKNSLGLFDCMEYWFVFVLFGFLMVAPFLARMTEGMSKLECKVFVFVGLGFNAIVTIADNLGIEFHWGYLFSGFAFTFVLGSLIDRLATEDRRRKALLGISLACFFADVFLRANGWSVDSLDVSPLYTIFSAGLYVGILDAAKNLNPSKTIQVIARHSFSVYLVHAMVLWEIIEIVPTVSGPVSILLHVGVTALVFVISLSLAVVIDKALIEPIQKLFDLLCEFGKKTKSPNL